MLQPTDLQRLLRAAGYYAGDIDGDIGPKTVAAVDRILQANAAALPTGQLSKARRRVMAAQLILNAAGFEVGAIDGYAGMLTKQALTDWNEEQLTGAKPAPWRPDDVPEEDDDRPLPAWGRQKDMTRRFGTPGGPQCTRGQVTPPYAMALAWNTRQAVRVISCHEEVAASVERVLKRVESAFAPEKIIDLGLHLFGGCFSPRKKRGGKSWSTHAWGVALDFDPERNQLKWGRDRARLAKDDAVHWWRCWEAEGWLSLGRARNFDWMHVQAPGL